MGVYDTLVYSLRYKQRHSSLLPLSSIIKNISVIYNQEYHKLLSLSSIIMNIIIIHHQGTIILLEDSQNTTIKHFFFKLRQIVRTHLPQQQKFTCLVSLHTNCCQSTELRTLLLWEVLHWNLQWADMKLRLTCPHQISTSTDPIKGKYYSITSRKPPQVQIYRKMFSLYKYISSSKKKWNKVIQKQKQLKIFLKTIVIKEQRKNKYQEI